MEIFIASKMAFQWNNFTRFPSVQSKRLTANVFGLFYIILVLLFSFHLQIWNSHSFPVFVWEHHIQIHKANEWNSFESQVEDTRAKRDQVSLVTIVATSEREGLSE